MDRLCTNMTRQIKGYKGDVVAGITVRNDNNRLQRCVYVRGTSLGVLSTGRIPIMVIGRFGCWSGPIGCECATWMSVGPGESGLAI